MAKAHLSYLPISENGLKNQIYRLTYQMQSEQRGSPEYLFDQLNLDAKKIELKTMEQDPDQNFNTTEGRDLLFEILGNNRNYENDYEEIESLGKQYSNESYTWGIPICG